MKISEVRSAIRYANNNKSHVENELQRLMDGNTLGDRALNYIMAYLGMLDEEAVCYGTACSFCPFSIQYTNIDCEKASSDYVREQVKKHIYQNRSGIEVLL